MEMYAVSGTMPVWPGPALHRAALASPSHVWDRVRDERGQRRLAGWMQAWDQTAGGEGILMSG